MALRFAAALLIVTLAASVFAILFHGLLGAVIRYGYGATHLVAGFQAMPWPARLLLPVLGGSLAGFIARWTARTSGGHGVGDVMEAVVFGRVRLSLSRTLLRSLGSFCAIAGGGSVGREGPLIQVSAALAKVTARTLRIDAKRSRILIASGTAAGFATAYNTPLAAVLFVLEVVTGMVALDAILPTLVATALATALLRSALGDRPIYGQRTFTLLSQHELIAHAFLGLLAAFAAHGFMAFLSWAEAACARSRIGQPLRAAFGGLLVGCVALLIPEVTGNGYEPLNALLDGGFSFLFVAGLFVAKLVATTASVATGSPGGVFTPTLLLGAALGYCFGVSLQMLVGAQTISPPGGYALVGMAAMTAATTHAPIMAAVLVFELSGDYAIVLPLLLATASSTFVARLMRADSIYTSELRRRGFRVESTIEGRRLSQPRRGPLSEAGRDETTAETGSLRS